MAAVTNATPLISLDAVVIDTETTGLDPRKARVIEIGAVRLWPGASSRARRSAAWCRWAKRSRPRSTAMHGIDAAKLAGRAAFREGLAEIPRLSSAAHMS